MTDRKRIIAQKLDELTGHCAAIDRVRWQTWKSEGGDGLLDRNYGKSWLRTAKCKGSAWKISRLGPIDMIPLGILAWSAVYREGDVELIERLEDGAQAANIKVVYRMTGLNQKYAQVGLSIEGRGFRWFPLTKPLLLIHPGHLTLRKLRIAADIEARFQYSATSAPAIVTAWHPARRTHHWTRGRYDLFRRLARQSIWLIPRWHGAGEEFQPELVPPGKVLDHQRRIDRTRSTDAR